jgi:hypothetical protein
MRLTRNQVCRKVPGVRIPPSPPFLRSKNGVFSGVKGDAFTREIAYCRAGKS